jgi:hypothetical protein
MTDEIINTLGLKSKPRIKSPQVNNNIEPLRHVRHIRLVNFDLDSPRMAEALINLGLVKEDINTKKTKDDFPSDDPHITKLHYRYYR